MCWDVLGTYGETELGTYGETELGTYGETELEMSQTGYVYNVPLPHFQASKKYEPAGRFLKIWLYNIFF